MTVKKTVGGKLALYPCPVAVIGTMATDGKPTWTLVAHMGIMGHDHVMVSLAQAHYINDFIKGSKVCSVNIVDEGFLAQADWCGIASGHKEDKSAAFAWSEGEAGAPIIDDAKLVMECRVEDIYGTEGFDNFIMTIAQTYVDEAILNEKGKIDYDAFKPVLFEMPSYTYLRTGETIAKCMTLGKELR